MRSPLTLGWWLSFIGTQYNMQKIATNFNIWVLRCSEATYFRCDG